MWFVSNFIGTKDEHKGYETCNLPVQSFTKPSFNTRWSWRRVRNFSQSSDTNMTFLLRHPTSIRRHYKQSETSSEKILSEQINSYFYVVEYNKTVGNVYVLIEEKIFQFKVSPCTTTKGLNLNVYSIVSF